MSAKATCGRCGITYGKCGFHPDLHFIKNLTTGVSFRSFIPSLFLWENEDKSVITHPNGVISSAVKTFLVDKILTWSQLHQGQPDFHLSVMTEKFKFCYVIYFEILISNDQNSDYL